MIPKQQNEPSGSTWLMDYRCLRLRAAKQPSPPRDLLCLGMMPFVDFLATKKEQNDWSWHLKVHLWVSMFCNYWFRNPWVWWFGDLFCVPHGFPELVDSLSGKKNNSALGRGQQNQNILSLKQWFNNYVVVLVIEPPIPQNRFRCSLVPWQTSK